MDIIKLINGVSTVIFTSYDGVKTKNEFRCLNCGCTRIYAHKRDYGCSFWEGHRHCIKCKKEVDYYSDDWVRSEIPTPTQGTLF